MTKGVLVRGVIVLGLIWGTVFLVTRWSGQRMATPEKVAETIDSAGFEDWSGREGEEMPGETKVRRRRKIEEIVSLFADLDQRERREITGAEDLMDLFRRLSDEEKVYLVDLIFNQNATKMMEVFDRMEPRARERMVERTLREMTTGEGGDALAHLQEIDPEIVALVVKKGMKTYFAEASIETKMALLPFMDAVGEMVQGFGRPRPEGL